MKTSILPLLLTTLLSLAPAVRAQTSLTADRFIGKRLEISQNGVNTFSLLATQSSSSVIGSNNTLSGFDGLAVGIWNTLSGWRNLVVGQNNDVSTADNSLVTGSNNEIWHGDFWTTNGSLVSGTMNLNSASSYSILSGWNNVALEAMCSFTHGAGLVNYWAYSTVIGKYNADTPEPASGLLFAVGNGTSATARSNAMEVYQDGRVIIKKAQGDILMGAFGN